MSQSEALALGLRCSGTKPLKDRGKVPASQKVPTWDMTG
jgi:hypothetical protein